MKNYYPEESFFGKAKFHPLFIIIFGLSLCITFISAIDVFIAKLSYFFMGVSYEEYTRALKGNNISNAYLNYFLFRLTVIQILGFGLTGWLLAASANRWKEELYFEMPFQLKKMVWAGLIMLLAIPFYQIFMISEENIGFLNPEDIKQLQSIEEQTQNLLNQIMRSHLFLNILVFAVVPAICEELFFRGFLFQNFRRFSNVFWAIFFSSLIFSLLHFQIYGFFVRWLMGAMLAFLFFYGKSIQSAIFAHFINNFFTTFVTWLALNGYISQEITDPSYQFHYLIVLFSFVLTVSLTFFYFKQFKDEKIRWE